MTQTTLITIPFSHYCEKARWMLDLAGIDYLEDAHLPLFHRVATRRHGGGSVPVLAIDGQALTDSRDIMRWIDGRHPILPTDPAARAEALAICADADAIVGPHVRRFMYAALLDADPALSALLRLGPPLQAAVVGAGRGLFRSLLRRSLRITPASAERSVTRTRSAFADLSRRLLDGRPYLAGDALSAADITFAALASPILMPAEHPIPWPEVSLIPEPLLRLQDELRSTPAGAHALSVYRNHRHRGPRQGA